MPAGVHTCIHKYMHASINACTHATESTFENGVHTCIHKYMHASINACTHATESTFEKVCLPASQTSLDIAVSSCCGFSSAASVWPVCVCVCERERERERAFLGTMCVCTHMTYNIHTYTQTCIRTLTHIMQAFFAASVGMGRMHI